MIQVDITAARALGAREQDALLNAICDEMNRAELVAILARGKARKEALAYAEACKGALLAITARDEPAMTDDELLQALGA